MSSTLREILGRGDHEPSVAEMGDARGRLQSSEA